MQRESLDAHSSRLDSAGVWLQIVKGVGAKANSRFLWEFDKRHQPFRQASPPKAVPLTMRDTFALFEQQAANDSAWASSIGIGLSTSLGRHLNTLLTYLSRDRRVWSTALQWTLDPTHPRRLWTALQAARRERETSWHAYLSLPLPDLGGIPRSVMNEAFRDSISASGPIMKEAMDRAVELSEAGRAITTLARLRFVLAVMGLIGGLWGFVTLSRFAVTGYVPPYLTRFLGWLQRRLSRKRAA